MTNHDSRRLEDVLVEAGINTPEEKTKTPRAVRLVADISLILIVLSLVVTIGAVATSALRQRHVKWGQTQLFLEAKLALSVIAALMCCA